MRRVQQATRKGLTLALVRLMSSLFVLAFTVLSFCALPGMAYASVSFTPATPATHPAHTETLMAGPYLIDVNLYQDPPMTDQAVEVTVVPHESGLRLSGDIFMVPGLGTDAIKLHAPLSPLAQSTTLTGSIRMPVRGAWNILVQLDGPQGTGQASFPITVAAPGAMPVWLGWLIALTPLLGIAWMIWQQRRYRLKLLMQREESLNSV